VALPGLFLLWAWLHLCGFGGVCYAPAIRHIFFDLMCVPTDSLSAFAQLHTLGKLALSLKPVNAAPRKLGFLDYGRKS
jgi:hypothetical protein